MAEIFWRTTRARCGWVAPGEGAWVSAGFLGLLAGHRAACLDCKELLILVASRAPSLLLPRHRNDC